MESWYPRLKGALSTDATPRSSSTEREWARAEVEKVLAPVYGSALGLGSVRRAPSIVWRNELELLPKPPANRWTLRVHLFEDRGRGADRYVGFINLRPSEELGQIEKAGETDREGPADRPRTETGEAGGEKLGEFPRIADAMLAPPLHLCTGSARFPALEPCSALYGEPHVPALPYSMGHPKLGGFCAQACTYMALVMLSRFGAEPTGPLDLTVARVLGRGTHFGPTDSIHKAGKHRIDIDGLNLEEMEDLLTAFSVSGELLHFHSGDVPEPVSAMVYHAVQCGLPVIAPVNYRDLYSNDDDLMAVAQNTEPEHSVVLVGYDRTQVYYHDPAVRPYMSAPLADVLNVVVPSETREGYSAILVCLPAGVSLCFDYFFADRDDPFQWDASLLCRSDLYDEVAREWTAHVGEPVPKDVVEASRRAVTSFMPSEHVTDYGWVLRRRTAAEGEPLLVAFNSEVKFRGQELPCIFTLTVESPEKRGLKAGTGPDAFSRAATRVGPGRISLGGPERSG